MEDGARPMTDNQLDHLLLCVSQALDSKLVSSDGFHFFAESCHLFVEKVRNNLERRYLSPAD